MPYFTYTLGFFSQSSCRLSSLLALGVSFFPVGRLTGHTECGGGSGTAGGSVCARGDVGYNRGRSLPTAAPPAGGDAGGGLIGGNTLSRNASFRKLAAIHNCPKCLSAFAGKHSR